MIKTILLAYDGSDNARRALDLAAELSASLNADLSIIHVLMHGRPAKELVQMAEVEHMVKEVRQKVPPEASIAVGSTYDLLGGTGSHDQTARVISAVGNQLVAYAKDRAQKLGASKVSASVRSGDYALEILEAATEQDADIIVIGSRGLGTIQGRFLGSVSQKVLHHADLTVVTVK